MAQLWAVFLAVGSLAIGMLGVLGVWLCYLFQAVAMGPPPAPPPLAPEPRDDDDDNDKNGLSKAELTQLGGVVLAEAAAGEEEALCPICLDAMEPGRAVRVLPACNRAFHQDCVDRWLAISPRCPVCNIWATPQSPRASPAATKTALGC
ncbi:E3 ubiquitin-protein ligase ATL23 [Brachypodium distachyon]|uniref:RING-type domain-containing protein n=1 Tax=Brachypodium distachyon TaxID=15368 RepID=I1ICH2_BRADI|nr:E3 ubiquitin-protein ligase ATL23 [Brachypodium distachyon]KQK00709.1 hypothetical protein BRADI_3g51330v3 [Brachypodium distachyon]|eukprot:XP_014756199.1 E3 ubiquitin-protein ligase ATL23 [Brachypodium distachyon]